MEKKKVIFALQENFEQRFTACSLPFLLMDRLLTLLIFVGYNGSELEGFHTERAQNISDQIKCYLAEKRFKEVDWKQFFSIDYDNDDLPIIRDLNGQKMIAYLFESLNDDGFFIKKPSMGTVHNLIDYMYFIKLFPEYAESPIDAKLFECEKLLFNLTNIKIDCPDFYKKLLPVKALKKSCRHCLVS